MVWPPQPATDHEAQFVQKKPEPNHPCGLGRRLGQPPSQLTHHNCRGHRAGSFLEPGDSAASSEIFNTVSRGDSVLIRGDSAALTNSFRVWQSDRPFILAIQHNWRRVPPAAFFSPGREHFSHLSAINIVLKSSRNCSLVRRERIRCNLWSVHQSDTQTVYEQGGIVSGARADIPATYQC